MLIPSSNLVFFVIVGMISGLLNQLQISRLLYVMEFLGLLIGLGLLEQQHLIYLRHLTRFDMLVFTSLGHIKFCIKYSALFCLLLVMDSFEWFQSQQTRDKVVSIDSFKQLEVVNNVNYVTSEAACILQIWLQVAHRSKLCLYLQMIQTIFLFY